VLGLCRVGGFPPPTRSAVLVLVGSLTSALNPLLAGWHLSHLVLHGGASAWLTLVIAKVQAVKVDHAVALQAMALCVSFGVLVELLQEWIAPGRSFSLADILADTVGSVCGGTLATVSLEGWQSLTQVPLSISEDSQEP